MNEQVLTPPAPPDLQILVRREEPKKLVFEARSDRLGQPTQDLGVVTLEGDLKALAQDELGRNVDDLSNLAKKNEQGQDRARRQLADLAVHLFQKLPEKLQELLWSCQGQIETLQILSAEPYFPWELLKLQGKGGEEGRFLCEAFSVTRWLPNMQTVGELPLQRMALMFPSNEELSGSKGEKDDLIELFGAERMTEIPPTFFDVKDALDGGDYDAWHFSGHGSARLQDPDSAMLWLDGEDFLTPKNLVTAKANLSRLRPLIFLNGCDTGRAGFSLTGIGGWAQQCLAAGAGAFIGTLWPVRDSKARFFAQAFYKAFLGGEPFGEAVRQARLRVRDQFPGDPAWLAYTAYAHPLASCYRLSRSSQERAEIKQPAPQALRIFLCHASQDKPSVRLLHKRLSAEGMRPWLDEIDLVAGQEWQYEIQKAVRSSDAVVVCLSRESVAKAGYIHKEIRYALDIAEEQSEVQFLSYLSG